MDYDEMPAGAEMDRLVAERVMGWPITVDPFGVTKAGCNRYIVPHDIEQGDLEDLAFKPSVNIAHAWEVIERLLAVGCPIILWQMEDGTWYSATTDGNPASGDHWIDDSIRYRTAAETAPLAICRIALRAVK